MNKNFSILILIGCFAFGCTDETDQVITREISKIETSFAERGKRDPQPSEISTAPDWYVEKIFQEEMARHANVVNNKRSSARVNYQGDYDIGLIVNNSTPCPSGSERITIYMDNQDVRTNQPPGTSVTAYDINQNHPWQIGAEGTTGWGDIKLTFCRVDGETYSTYNRYRGTHAVLRLGPLNPPGTNYYTVARHFDNEDNSNSNYHSGDIQPNIRDRNTTLYFATYQVLFAPAIPLPTGLGVFATHNPAVGDTWKYYIDDEDSNNANYWTFDGIRYSSYNGSYMGGGANTYLFVLMAH